MDELRAVFASNLIRLRSAAGWTQAELGERLHYSDKSVSKWERAEAIPDALVLKTMGELFSVTVDELLRSHDEWKPKADQRSDLRYNPMFIILCALVGLFTLCLLSFIILWLLDDVEWLLLYAAVPADLIVLLVFNTIWYRGRHNLYIIMALVLSLILLAFFLFGRWQLILLLLPLELLVYLAFKIRKTRDKT
ncbi:MAG: helix-turn-helix transcriptional regulator [Oscillospiraceae bacterium]|nr:helix-turn-helix transcriptional regulator [Oscillospiraceae bacterium]MBR3083483.1 helix-turn-helix transcriptional regulator [Oscillospiraceae bacterium]MBR3861345.1 helix-turn-helix transcriptional regulator [Oscillospiraceae bacterium]MBR6095542.1 helix-turn-helix transcriptional regulator [Oscillospiraceae bacterium]